MATMTGEPLEAGLVGAGLPPAVARETARHVDDRMKDAILRLYRSAVHVGREWQPDLERVRRPALVLWGREDPFVPPVFAERLAERVHGELVLFEGCGHWWAVERAAEAAAALERFWARV
jgi:pimeloyl-ACP methyl ester carboxylesterase